MARSDHDMANVLMDIYLENNNKRYQLTQQQFKRIAGKQRLRRTFIAQVDSFLRKNGYTIIDLRNEENSLAIVRIAAITKFDRIMYIEDWVFEEDDDEWNKAGLSIEELIGIGPHI